VWLRILDHFFGFASVPGMRLLICLDFVLFVIAVSILPMAATGGTAGEEVENVAVENTEGTALRDAVLEKYGEEYLVEIIDEQKLVFATNADRETLDILREGIAAHEAVLQQELFPNPRQHYVAVVIPENWTQSGKGYFQFEERTVLLQSPSGAVMQHEFTHAAHLDDQQERGQLLHQNWIIEGLGALFENYEIIDGKMTVLPNYRQKVIQDLARDGRHKPWAEYVEFSRQKFMTEPRNHYSQARYIFAYVHEQGLLKEWYQAYVDGYDEDISGGRSLEKVFAKPLAEIEREWLEWLLSLPPFEEASSV